MKLNRALLQASLLLLVVGLALGLVVEHQTWLSRTREHQNLEQQMQQLRKRIARNEELSARLAQQRLAQPLSPEQLMELLRLRGQLSVLNRSQKDLEQARKENRQVHAVMDQHLKILAGTNVQATADYWPQSAWKNSGYGSPESALQTLFWTGYNGDLTNFLASLSDPAQKEMAAELQKKSKLQASVSLADETYYLQSVQILDREAADDNTVVLTVELENQDGFETVKMVMKRSGGDWKFNGPQQ